MNTSYNRNSHKQQNLQQNYKEQLIEGVELRCMEALKEHLIYILETAKLQESALKHKHQQIVSNLKHQNDQLQQQYQEMMIKYENLVAQNNQYKLNFNRYTTTIKQLQKKDKLLSNQVTQLNKTIAQKDAVIKYLEQKQEQSKTKQSINQSQDSDSCLSNSRSKVFVPSLQLQRLSLAQPSKQTKFQDFMPQTTRSIDTDNFTRQNYIASQQIKRQHYSKQPSLQNTQQVAKCSDHYTERSFESSKLFPRNQSSFLLKHYNKAYDYSLWKHSNHNNYTRQYQSSNVDASPSIFYNRSSLTMNRFRI